MADLIVNPGFDETNLGSTKNVSVKVINGALSVTPSPSTDSASATPIVATTASAQSLVLKNSACNLYGFSATCSLAGYVMLFDATSAPADGTVQPKRAYPVSANTSIEIGFLPGVRMTNGAVLVISTTGPFTKTTGASVNHLAGEVL